MLAYIVFTLAVALATICVSYDSFARTQGWPVGEILDSGASITKIAAMITVFWALGKAVMMLDWWSPLPILAMGWLVAFLATAVLRKNVQFLGIVGVYPALAATVLYGAGFAST